MSGAVPEIGDDRREQRGRARAGDGHDVARRGGGIAGQGDLAGEIGRQGGGGVLQRRCADSDLDAVDRNAVHRGRGGRGEGGVAASTVALETFEAVTVVAAGSRPGNGDVDRAAMTVAL